MVFDLETTGFSPQHDAIIEIGAVKVQGGEVTDRYSVFVNPGRPIPLRITELTSIDDAMVAGFAADAGGDDLPPFDVPATASAPKPAATAPKEEDAPAAPWESSPGAGSPFGHQGAAPSIPQTEDEAKALIRSVFGQSTIFRPVE